MGTAGIPRGNRGNGDHIHGNTVGTGPRLTGLPWGWGAMHTDSNTAVKWKRDEQCSLVTLLTACWSRMDSKLCSLGLKMGQNLFFIYV